MTPIQHERLERIRAQASSDLRAEIDLLVDGLVHGREAGGVKDAEWALRELADGWIQNNEREGEYGFYRNAQRVLDAVANDTATAMRSACVEQLRERLHDPSLRFSDDGIKAAVTDWTNMLIGILESLTFNQVGQEHK